mgnify:CR=1 FL=1
MVKIIAKNYVKFNKVKEVLEFAEELVHLAVKENGCIKYEMYQRGSCQRSSCKLSGTRYQF